LIPVPNLHALEDMLVRRIPIQNWLRHNEQVLGLMVGATHEFHSHRLKTILAEVEFAEVDSKE
jgi:hypothetical protein